MQKAKNDIKIMHVRQINMLLFGGNDEHTNGNTTRRKKENGLFKN